MKYTKNLSKSNNNQNVWSLCYDATLAYKVLQREHVAPLDANLAAVLDMLATPYMGVWWKLHTLFKLFILSQIFHQNPRL